MAKEALVYVRNDQGEVRQIPRAALAALPERNGKFDGWEIISADQIPKEQKKTATDAFVSNPGAPADSGLTKEQIEEIKAKSKPLGDAQKQDDSTQAQKAQTQTAEDTQTETKADAGAVGVQTEPTPDQATVADAEPEGKVELTAQAPQTNEAEKPPQTSDLSAADRDFLKSLDSKPEGQENAKKGPGRPRTVN